MNIRKIAGFALGPIGSAALGVLTLPLISWFFSSADIGRIALLQTAASLILIALGLGLDQAYIREFHAQKNTASLLKSVLIVPFGLLLLIALALATQATWFANAIFETADGTLGIIALLFCAALVFTRYLSIILRMQERAWAFSFSQLAPKLWLLLAVAAATLLPNAQRDTQALTWAYALAQSATVLLLAWQTRSALFAACRAPFEPTLLQQNLRYGMPLALSGLAYWGLVSADRLLLKQFANLEAVGVYAMAANFGALAFIVQSIFSTVWAPTLFRWVNENRDLAPVHHIFRLLLGLVLAILCIVGLASPVLTWLLPTQYADVQYLVLSVILFPLLYTLSEVSGIGINVSRQTKLAALISLAAMLCNVLLCYWLIPVYQAHGAAIATACSFWLFFALKTEASIRLWQAFSRPLAYGSTLVAVAVSLAYTHLGSPQNYPYFALFWLASLGVLAYLYRLDLLKLKQFVQQKLKN
ncbi:MAG: lipopolysaccharide biosynthesis protein [Neisseria sp.]|nr:lipopolysaccharide biosynthesis protein [Neisseria sp.]